jgi:hypothetical protein
MTKPKKPLAKSVRTHVDKHSHIYDRKLSDREVRRVTCIVGGKAVAEAGTVTHGAVRWWYVGVSEMDSGRGRSVECF